MKDTSGTIFTPEGPLSEVENNPNLGLLMNIFNIPRAFSVSGFGGGWDVGKHSFATALIAIYWARFNRFESNRRDKLVTLALLHDIHESATGDILPMFKTGGTRQQLDRIQNNITSALGVENDHELQIHIKIVDLIAFLYEIQQVSPSILRSKQLALANAIADKQLHLLLSYCKQKNVSQATVRRFLKSQEII